MHEVNHESIDAYCLSKPGVTVSTPFGPTTLVYKVGGKMFALLGTEGASLNLKCDPDLAVELRENYEAVEPGYHMNKRLWNSIYWERGGVTGAEVATWIEDSYRLIVAGLPAVVRNELRAHQDA